MGSEGYTFELIKCPEVITQVLILRIVIKESQRMKRMTLRAQRWKALSEQNHKQLEIAS